MGAPANRFNNIGADATKNVSTRGVAVFSLKCHNANAAARYLQLHNTATVPADQAVPFDCHLVPATAEIIVGTDYFGVGGLAFSVGLAFAFSTTRDTYTAGSASDQLTTIRFA